MTVVRFAENYSFLLSLTDQKDSLFLLFSRISPRIGQFRQTGNMTEKQIVCLRPTEPLGRFIKVSKY